MKEKPFLKSAPFFLPILFPLLYLLPFSPSLYGEVFGMPGDTQRAFSFRTGAGIGYTVKDLSGTERDTIQRLDLLLPRVTLFVHDFVEVGGNLLVSTMTRRKKYGFTGEGGDLGGEGFVRIYPLLQGENARINLGIEGGGGYRKNRGIRKRENETISDTLRETYYYGSTILSYKEDLWVVYGGVLGEFSTVKQSSVEGKKGNFTPFGVFFGVDFFVNPYIFFTLEFHNFYKDAIFLGVGADLTP